MSRVLVVEPDPIGRTLVERCLTAAGHLTDEVATVDAARSRLDDDAFDLAVVDELGGGAPLDAIRFLRSSFPRLPVVVTGTLLTASVLRELLALGVAGALPKPFSPTELRETVAHALARRAPHHQDAQDFAASVHEARRWLSVGATTEALRSLARAHRAAPFEPEVMALEALASELRGDDDAARRGYCASLGLGSTDAYESLARLAHYTDAPRVTAFDARFRAAPQHLVTDPQAALASLPEGPVIVVFPVSLGDFTGHLVGHRQHGDRAFVVATTDHRPERLSALLATLGQGPILAPTLTDDERTRLLDAREGHRERASATTGGQPR